MIRLLVRVTFGAVLTVILCVAGAYVYINLLAKAGIERGGEYALGVRASVGSIDIDIVGGHIDVHDFELANPAGFAEPVFIRLGSGVFHLPLRNVLEPTISVPLLAFDDIDVNVERRHDGSNYGTILGHLKQFESSESEATTETQNARALIIDELRITNVNARLSQEALGGQSVKVDVVVPEIRMRNVGSKSGGVTMAELSGIVTKALLDAIARADGVPGAILRDLTGNLQSLTKIHVQLPEGVRKTGGSLDGLSRQIGGEVGKRLDDTLGGLLGKPKSRDEEPR
jgi:hypothetical protein